MIGKLLPGLVSAFIALPLGGALAQRQGNDWMWHSSSGWGHMIFGGLMMILFWGAVIVSIIFLVRWLSGHLGSSHSPAPTQQTPLDILKERFARGEIDKDEYEERRKLLSE